MRGPTYKGSLTGGAKSLFRLPPKGPPLPRLVLAEAAIDALSVAAIESLRKDTLYAATGGGMGPGTIAALEALLASIAMLPGALLCSAADANGPGDRCREPSWLGLINSWCKSPSYNGIIRARSNSTPARPYMARLRVFSLLICPSVCPLLQGSDIAFCTASRSWRIAFAKRCMA